MFDELKEVVKEFLKKLFSSRLFALAVIFTLMYAGLIGKLFNLQIIHGDEYQQSYMQRTEKMVTAPGTRGNIYDRNGKLLAYNELAYSVTIQDLGDYPRPADRNAMIYRLVTILERRGEKVEGKLEIAINEQGEMYFTTTSKASHKRFLLNFYGISSEKLDDASGRYPSDITAREAFELKKSSGRDGYNLNDMKDEEGNPLELTDQTALDMINIIYTMKLTEYQKYESTTVATNVSRETMTEIHENAADLKGVSVEESYIRVYNDSLYFSPIIGYTGKVQEEQVDRLNEQWREEENKKGKNLTEEDEKYNLNDVVGRIGIEQYMELDLQGEKGYTKMYVDNMGRPREVIEQQDAKAGNDVYLTIDRDLQIATYKLMEQQLAGIITKFLVNEDVDPATVKDGSKKPIPVKNAYYQLINNNVLSLEAMAEPDASSVENKIYSTYTSSKTQILTDIKNELLSPHARAMNDLPEDMKSYMNYIYSFLASEETGIIKRDKIDTSSEEYLSWKEGTISLRDYIYSGISGNWIDTTKLDSENKYSNADDSFAQLVDYICVHLEEDGKFTKRMFRYLINNEVIRGSELCLALFDQGVLEPDPGAQAALAGGDSVYAYNFIKKKISNLELTPAQLALDPCTAGAVVTDVRTGEVLALVSYPSYDNNEMSGSVDAAYFAKLQNDMSNPLYNNATQAIKAPGSTFKPITAVAALEEGVISLTDTIECTGSYDLSSPPINCWVFPGRHGVEDIVTGIQNSCNVVFAELGHRLSLTEDGTYSSEKGLEAIRKYASMFGLDHTSGIELPETEPHLTTEDPERSAMGQGTNSYSNVQLSRYISAVANRGTVFELSLLDKLTDSDGNLIEDYTPETSSQIEAKTSTWDAVQSGIRRVVTEGSAKSVFAGSHVEVAGKTGTAQEDRSRSNHAFFVSFAPYSNPEIAVTVNIPYGYAGTNAASLGKQIYEYYYGYTSFEEIVGSGALSASNSSVEE